MIRLALSAGLGAALAIFLTWDASILAKIVAAPLGASFLALALALLFSNDKTRDKRNTEGQTDPIEIHLAESELEALDQWRQSNAQHLTRAEAARFLLVKPLLDSSERSK